ncbi:MAG: hypothetical protein JXM70_14055 [Pirellulales bacterium]|nr:hypothetical protein [Pirellulales bacterium]
MAPFRKVKAGAPLNPPASDYNAMIDAAKAHAHGSGRRGVRSATSRPYAADILMAKNASGADIAIGTAVVIDGPIINADDNLNEFLFRLGVNIVAVSSVSEEKIPGRWGVALKPMADGVISTNAACLAGACPAQVNILDVGHGTVELDAATGQLVSAPRGSAALLSTPTETGVQWCVIRLGYIAAESFKAKITGSTSIGSNRWSYQWAEQTPNISGTWVTRDGGRTSTSIDVAYNDFEANNTASGVQGCGVNVDNLNTGITLRPIGVGAVVTITLWTDCNGDIMPTFEHPNQPDGECV